MKQNSPKPIIRPLSNVSPAARQYAPWFGVALLLLLLLPFGLVRSAWGAAYHGQVVDAETGKPIEGAVVMVEWHKKPRVSISDINYFHNAREVLTDAEGKFSLDSSPGIDWNPFTYVKEPRIIAFYPGYRPFTPAHPEDIGTKSDLNKIAEAFERGVVVKLLRLKTNEELRNISIGPIMAPWEYRPHLMRLMNTHYNLAGAGEYLPPEDGQGRKP